MPNRLAQSTSPYLRQHADNPVDWWEWGADAFAEALQRDVPVLLSVGYSACHWCHVMAHESFEDQTTADILNANYVNVKVDREERPDVDAVYMEAVQALTGRGGWPMTVWLTPDRKPFYAGTYFPNADRPGMPAFTRVLDAVSHAWDHDRESLLDQAGRLTDAIDKHLPIGGGIDSKALEQAYQAVIAQADPINGGFGGAPKFPQAPTLEFLLRLAGRPWAAQAKPILRQALIKMARGGIYDHVIGGFARYSVDERWLVPHFEKMLYDNAQLARIYLRAGQMLDDPSMWTITEEILGYLNSHLRHEDGGYFSAEDADSEGVEGKFAVFTADEFKHITGLNAEVASMVFGVTDHGNFEGNNVLWRERSHAEVAESLGLATAAVDSAVGTAIAALRRARAERIKPGLDDKVVTSWNGLAIRAFAEAGAVLGSDTHLEDARACARFVLSELVNEDGRLLRSWSQGRATTPGFLEDYSAMALGLFSLYQATGEIEWYREAERLTREMVRLFSDSEGAMFSTGSDAEELITRKKDQMDNPLPSGNSMAAEALTLLGSYTGAGDLFDSADQIVRAGSLLADKYPSSVGHLLSIVASIDEGFRELAVTGPDAEDLAAVVWQGFHPEIALAVDANGQGGSPLLENRHVEGQTLAYLCESFVCQRPVSRAEDLAQLIN